MKKGGREELVVGTFNGARPVLGKGGGGGSRFVSDLARLVISRVSSIVTKAGSLLKEEGAELVRSLISCTRLARSGHAIAVLTFEQRVGRSDER